jgi:MinD-like ATPase involved in chromosome partitioning or flagellar assembly
VTISVITAIADPRWEADLVAGLAQAEGVTVVRRCVDVADLIATASAGIASGVVVSADLRRLDREMITRLDVMGIAVVGICTPDDEAAEQTLRRLGITHVVSADAPAAEVVDRLRAAVQALSTGASPPTPAPVSADDGEPSDRAPGGGEAPDERTARMIAVWGPTGAPGRTTVAIGLAAELAAAGNDVVLVDADVYGGTIAPALGILDGGAGFASACRLANAGRLDAAALAGLAVVVEPRLRVLSGIARADRWGEVRPSAVAAVLALARTMTSYVVVDCGFCLEEDEELSYDTTAPRRNGATVTALRAAGTVIAVGSGDPIGLQRLVHGLTELHEAVPEVDPVVVVNRVRARVAGPGEPRRQISDALREFAQVDPAAFVPLDQPASDKAVARAQTLVAAAPASPARQALAAFAADLSAASGQRAPVAATGRWSWWRR